MTGSSEGIALNRYLLEIEPAANGYLDLHELTERSRAACAEMTSHDQPVHLLRSVFLPEDGTFLFVFDAASGPYVEEAGRRAELPVRRIAALLTPATAEQGAT
jgi:hypothetical protein